MPGGIPTSSPSVIPTIQAMSGFAQLGWVSIRHRKKIINANMTFSIRAIMKNVTLRKRSLCFSVQRNKTEGAQYWTVYIAPVEASPVLNCIRE